MASEVSLAPISIFEACLKIILRECLCKFQTFNGEDVWDSVRCDDLPDDNPWKTENMCGDPSQAIETQACHEDRECAKSDGVGPGIKQLDQMTTFLVIETETWKYRRRARASLMETHMENALLLKYYHDPTLF